MGFAQGTVLVTGHNGFIGRQLCELLLFKGWSVIGLGRGLDSKVQAGIVSYEIDILNKVDVRNVIVKHNPAMIIHLAGGPTRVSEGINYRECFDINLKGSLNVIDAAFNVSNLEKFIFLGSCEEYGPIDVPFNECAREMPTTAYGMAKLSVTHLLQALAKTQKFPSVILRPSVVYGPGQKRSMFLYGLIDHLLKGQLFDMSLGDQTRDFVYIEDLLNAIMLAMLASNIGGEIINISSYVPIFIKDLAQKVAEQIDNGARSLINYGAKDYRLGEPMNYYANNSKSKAMLDWTPQIDLTQGVGRTIEWQRFNTKKFYKNET
jgi:nucleoside-diphosphate-sugar epimerase